MSAKPAETKDAKAPATPAVEFKDDELTKPPGKEEEVKLIDFTAEHLAREKALDERFKALDFKKASEPDVVSLFPSWAQEKYALRNVSRKQISNAVNIEHLQMKTPFGDKILIKDSPLILEAGRRACLFGQNSTGKTLLFTNISEAKIKDFPKHIHVHHCRELEAHELLDTVLEAVINSHPLRRILVRIEAKINEELKAAGVTDEEKKNLNARLDFVKMNMNQIRAYDAEDRAAKMLRVLGFDETGQKKLVSALSGGLRMRVALCMAFFIDAELLLLDEPTNHLDFPSVLWLENRLRGYGKSFLVVSHDRELLNNVVTGVILLEDQNLKYYNTTFKEFEKKKATEDKKKSDEIDKFLATNRNVDPSSPLGAQKATKKAWSDQYSQKMIAMQGKFTFPVATPLENKDNRDPKDIVLIHLKDVRFSYDVKTGHFIFNDPISFDVTATTRCGVMGPNGAGKSTFLKLLTHKLIPTDGTVTHHPNYVLAYFGQHSTAELDLQATPAEWMQEQFPEEKIGLLRQHLQKTSVVGTVQDTRMMRLSFSQRSCVIFSKLTYKCPHLLILDEPTNFLDLESVDALISACNKYKGALLLVSHNRDFLRKCATHYLSIVPGKFDLFDNMKKAEQSTYTFIAEMEEGVKGVGRDALANNPGGAAIHSRQVAGGKTEEKKAGAMVIGGSSAPAPKPGSAAEKALLERKAAAAAAANPNAAASAAAAKPAAAGTPVFVVGEKCMALWKDGKTYTALVEKVVAKDKYQVKYLEYGNSAQVGVASLKKITVASTPAGKGGKK